MAWMVIDSRSTALNVIFSNNCTSYKAIDLVTLSHQVMFVIAFEGSLND